MLKRLTLTAAALLIASTTAFAHVGDHPSIQDTMAGILQRLTSTLSHEELKSIDVDRAKALITEEELHILGTEYLTFTVNVPVTVHVFRDADQREIPFWLESRDFARTDISARADGEEFEAWTKDFDAGFVGLGIQGFEGDSDQYFVALTPQNAGETVEVTDFYPGQHKVSDLVEGRLIYVDDIGSGLEEVPEELEGAMMVRTIQERSDEFQLVNLFRTTLYPATQKPDQVTLTWSDDPKTTQTVQWRTSPQVETGIVRFGLKDAITKGTAPEYETVTAEMSVLEDEMLVNDPINHRFTATMRELAPDTTYAYQVGADDGWSPWYEFTTAPAGDVPFTFIYMGDAQNGLDTWGKLAHNAFRAKPDAEFYVMAGDLVNRGIERDDWDSFFHNAAGIYDRRQLVPAIGNHEDQGEEGPWMYLDVFDLPDNGPSEIDNERAYSIEYSNALFVVLDTNTSIPAQTEWLEEQLASSDATWKFVVYHHPAYSSAPRRDNPTIRKYWTPLFDKYQVDLALQGHDHAYLRTYPMKGEEAVDSAEDGTIYIVSVSGTKYYDQDPREYTAFGMTNVSTYQVLDIRIDGDTLTYKAYDMNGDVRDEFVIEK